MGEIHTSFSFDFILVHLFIYLLNDALGYLALRVGVID